MDVVVFRMYPPIKLSYHRGRGDKAIRHHACSMCDEAKWLRPRLFLGGGMGDFVSDNVGFFGCVFGVLWRPGDGGCVVGAGLAVL